MVKQPRSSTEAVQTAETIDDFGADFDGGVIAIPPLSDAYPYDGRAVLLTEDGVRFVAAYWRRTRAYRGGRWDDQAFWAHRHTKTPIPFTPIGFKPFEEEPLLGPAPKGAAA